MKKAGRGPAFFIDGALAYWAGLNPADFVCLDSPAPVASRNADDCLQFVNGAVPA